MKKVIYLLFFLGLLFQRSFNAQGEELLLKNIKVYIDFTIAEQETASQEIIGQLPYFKVRKENGNLKSLFYFDRWGHPAHFTINTLYQLSFFRAELEYIKGGDPAERLVKMTLWDSLGLPTGYIKYNWDNKKVGGKDGQIRSVEIFSFKGANPKGFYKREKRSFIFGGGGDEKNIGQLSQENPLTRFIYNKQEHKDSKLFKDHRYSSNSAPLYTKEYRYEGSNVKEVLYVSDQGVLLYKGSPLLKEGNIA